MKFEIKNQTFLKLPLANGDMATYIATRVKNDLSGNPRYVITVVYNDYAMTTSSPVQSYNIVETIKHFHDNNQ